MEQRRPPPRPSSRPPHRLRHGLAVFALLLVAACGGRSILGLSPQQEMKIGAEQHPQIVQQFGLYDDPEMQAYVERISADLQQHSPWAGRELTVTVLDSPEVNAFALPGGYLYVTRGLLAYANSEAELAGVLGHELAHVTRRHAAKRIERANIANILGMGAGILTGSGEIAQIALQSGQLLVLKYSRDQEIEADREGIRYLAGAGYDPYAMADFLETLEAQKQLQAKIERRDPAQVTFLSTHPATAKRVVEAIEEAETAGVPIAQAPRKREAYLQRLDGMIFGDSPEQGFILGRRFVHPELRFTFTVPEGFNIVNTPQAVLAVGPERSQVQLTTAADARDPAAYIREVVAPGLKIELGGLQRLQVSGMPAASATGQAAMQNAGRLDVRVVTVQFAPDRLYTFVAVTPAALTAQLAPGLEDMIQSFRRLSDEEAAEARPLVLDIAQVEPGQTLAALAALTAWEEFAEDRFLVLNGLSATEGVNPGTPVKLVTQQR